MLTKEQQIYYDEFENAIKEKRNLLYSSHQRAWGKSSIINELGLTFQALGYRAFLITQFPNSQEHYATHVLMDDVYYSFKRQRQGKEVILVDEYKHSKIKELLKECDQYKVPVVGFLEFD